MTTLFDILNDLEAKAKAATTNCITCGNPASIYSSGEGTNSYECVIQSPETVLTLITALREAESAIKALYVVSLNPPNDVSGRELFDQGKDWLAKYVKGEE